MTRSHYERAVFSPGELVATDKVCDSGKVTSYNGIWGTKQSYSVSPYFLHSDGSAVLYVSISHLEFNKCSLGRYSRHGTLGILADGCARSPESEHDFRNVERGRDYRDRRMILARRPHPWWPSGYSAPL